jgi:hypothetical protein
VGEAFGADAINVRAASIQAQLLPAQHDGLGLAHLAELRLLPAQA